jgi:hypothetical protein
MAQASNIVLLGWAAIGAAVALGVALTVTPSLIMFAIPLHKTSGLAAAVETLLLFVSPMAAAAGGGLLIAHKPGAGGITIALAGIGTLISWWGPIGWAWAPVLLTVGAIGLGETERHGAAAPVVGLFFPFILYAGTASMFSPAMLEAKLAKVESSVSEIAGTLRWQEEWPILKAEQDRLQLQIDATKKQFRIALLASSFASSVAAFFVSGPLTRKKPLVGRCLYYGGWLCLLQGTAVLLGVFPLLW